MVARDVEQLEVELVGLDLGRLVGDEAELAEDARDLALRLDERMKRAARECAAGQRDVGLLARQAHVERDLVEPRRGARAMAASSSSRIGLASAPTLGRSSPGSWPMPPSSLRSSPFLPRYALSTPSSSAGRPPFGQPLTRDRGDRRAGRRRTPGPRRVCRYLALATSAMLANVAASRTAMSARTLRSRATPACLSPLISLL